MRTFLARWTSFGLVATVAVLIASALALTLTRIALVAPEADAALTTSTPSASPVVSASAAPARLPVGVERTGGLTFYTVQTFDVGRREGTLAYIAARFNTTVAQLVSWNSIKNPDLIHPGQRLRVS
jgi:nucleoid-associated protein YgaU